MNRHPLAAILTALLLAVAPLAGAQTLAIEGGHVHTGSGEDYENATVLIVDGRIREVSASVQVPPGARRIDVTGKIVTPGLFDAATEIGLIEVGSLADTRDYERVAGEDDAIRASFRVTDGLNVRSIIIPITRLGGVTTVASIPSGGVLSGQGVVLDLLGTITADMTVRDAAAMYGAFNPTAATLTGGARGALALALRRAFEDARNYADSSGSFDLGRSSISRGDAEALAPILDGSMPLIVRASRAADIETAVRIAEEIDIEIAILGAEEAWRIRDWLAQTGTSVIVKAYSNLPLQFDRLASRFDNAGLLSDAGVPVVLSTMDTHNARNLRFEAGQAVRHGMSWNAALRAVTLAPAELMGVAATHGSLAAGKVANVVVWSADPFDFQAEAERIFIRGREIDHDSRQLRLLERYRSLDGRPVQYKDTAVNR